MLRISPLPPLPLPTSLPRPSTCSLLPLHLENPLLRDPRHDTTRRGAISSRARTPRRDDRRKRTTQPPLEGASRYAGDTRSIARTSLPTKSVSLSHLGAGQAGRGRDEVPPPARRRCEEWSIVPTFSYLSLSSLPPCISVPSPRLGRSVRALRFFRTSCFALLGMAVPSRLWTKLYDSQRGSEFERRRIPVRSAASALSLRPLILWIPMAEDALAVNRLSELIASGSLAQIYNELQSPLWSPAAHSPRVPPPPAHRRPSLLDRPDALDQLPLSATLHAAAWRQDALVVFQLLLDRGADPLATSAGGRRVDWDLSGRGEAFQEMYDAAVAARRAGKPYSMRECARRSWKDGIKLTRAGEGQRPRSSRK